MLARRIQLAHANPLISKFASPAWLEAGNFPWLVRETISRQLPMPAWDDHRPDTHFQKRGDNSWPLRSRSTIAIDTSIFSPFVIPAAPPKRQDWTLSSTLCA
jgi:hypothetical protein